MILSKTVQVKISRRNIKHYLSLGYVIPKHTDIYNRLCNQIGILIEVSIGHLLKGSKVKVLCKCDECGKENLTYYNESLKFKYICKNCAANQPKRLEKLKNAMTGKKHSEETKKKMSEHNWAKNHTGKLHPCYNSNLTFEDRYLGRNRNVQPENYQWKKKVKERDNHICQKCGSKENLCVHHLNNYKSFENERYDIKNGITLCVGCHKEFHKRYGRLTTKEQIKDFIG